MVGGMTECTRDALAQPATNAAQAMGPDNVYAISDLHCADGWAVTGGVLANKANPDMGAPTSFVFEQEGQFWIPKDKARVCGTNPTTTTAPADLARRAPGRQGSRRRARYHAPKAAMHTVERPL